METPGNGVPPQKMSGKVRVGGEGLCMNRSLRKGTATILDMLKASGVSRRSSWIDTMAESLLGARARNYWTYSCTRKLSDGGSEARVHGESDGGPSVCLSSEKGWRARGSNSCSGRKAGGVTGKGPWIAVEGGLEVLAKPSLLVPWEIPV